jgi:hypothetical protein
LLQTNHHGFHDKSLGGAPGDPLASSSAPDDLAAVAHRQHQPLGPDSNPSPAACGDAHQPVAPDTDPGAVGHNVGEAGDSHGDNSSSQICDILPSSSLPAACESNQSDSDTRRTTSARRRKLAAGGSLPPSIMVTGSSLSGEGPDLEGGGDPDAFKIPQLPPRSRSVTIGKLADETNKVLYRCL